MIAAVSALKAPVSLQTRVGIATGLVVVGDLIGSGRRRSEGLSGRRRTSQPVCKASLSRTPSSSLRAHESCSAVCSSFRTSALGTQGHFRARYGRGRRCGQARWKAVRGAAHQSHSAGRSGRGTRIVDAPLVKERKPAKDKWCCSLAKRASGSRGSPDRRF